MRTYPLPAPVGGWNARDNLDQMSPTDAIEIVNFLPRETVIETRTGCERINSLLSTTKPVKTIASFRKSGGTNNLIIGSNAKLFRVDIAGNTIVEIGTGYSDNKWQTTNFNDRLLLINGSDDMLEWNGTTLTANASLGSPITGVSAADLWGLVSFKSRMYYWKENDTSFWYAAADSYTAALTEFDLTYISESGGSIVECCTWTRDAGDGMDDLFVILFDTGETLVYQGTDPGADFSLIGKFQLGEPLNIRGSTKVASDRLIITKDGYVNLSTAMQQARLSEGNVSNKIIREAKRATQLYSNDLGWQAVLFPKESLLIINVPVDEDNNNATQSTYEQHVLNTNTGAWARLTGWQAITFVVHEDELYFGSTDGYVYKAFTGTSDNGEFIQSYVIPAFNPLGDASRNKQLTMCTVVTDYYQPDYMEVEGLSNFNAPFEGTFITPPDGSVVDWGSDWSTDFWSSIEGAPINAINKGVGGFGYSHTVRVQSQSKVQTHRIYSVKYKYKNARSI